MARTRTSLLGLLFVLGLGMMAAQNKPRGATYVPAADVELTLQKAPAGVISDQPIRMVDAGGYNVGVAAVSRPKEAKLNNPVEHDKVTEIYYVLEGSGTLVTGGTLANPQPRPATMSEVVRINGPSVSGTAVHGGETRRIQKGDVVIIPAGVVHWFSEVQESLRYVVIRMDPEKVVPLK